MSSEAGDDVAGGSGSAAGKRSGRERGKVTNPPSPTAASKRTPRAATAASGGSGTGSSTGATAVPSTKDEEVKSQKGSGASSGNSGTSATNNNSSGGGSNGGNNGGSGGSTGSARGQKGSASAIQPSGTSAQNSGSASRRGSTASRGGAKASTSANSTTVAAGSGGGGGTEGEVQLFCLCRQPYDTRKFMVGCDVCEDWFHPRCVNITVQEAESIQHFICPNCRKKAGKELLALVPGSNLDPNALAAAASPSAQSGYNPLPGASSSSKTVQDSGEGATSAGAGGGSRKRGREDSARAVQQQQQQQYQQQRQQQISSSRQAQYQQQQQQHQHQQQQVQQQSQQQYQHQQHRGESTGGQQSYQAQQQAQQQQQQAGYGGQYVPFQNDHVGRRLATSEQGPGLSALRGAPLGSVSVSGVTPEGIARRQRHVSSDFVMLVRLTPEEVAYSDVESEDDSDVYLSSDDDDEDDAGVSGMGLGDIDVAGSEGEIDIAMVNADDGPGPYGLDAGEYTPPLGITQILPVRSVRKPDAPAAALKRVAMMHIREFQNRFQSYVESARKLGQHIRVEDPPHDSIEALGFGFTPHEIDLDREVPIEVNNASPQGANQGESAAVVHQEPVASPKPEGAEASAASQPEKDTMTPLPKAETFEERIARIDPGPLPEVLTAPLPPATASAALLFPPLPGIAARVSLTDFTGISDVRVIRKVDGRDKYPEVVVRRLFSLNGHDFISAVDEHPHALQKLWNNFAFTPALIPAKKEESGASEGSQQTERGSSVPGDQTTVSEHAPMEDSTAPVSVSVSPAISMMEVEVAGDKAETSNTDAAMNDGSKTQSGDQATAMEPKAESVVLDSSSSHNEQKDQVKSEVSGGDATGDQDGSKLTEDLQADQLEDTSNAIFRGYLSPDDVDEAYLAFLTSRRADAELALIRIEQKKRIMLAGLAYAQRRTLLQTLLVKPVPPSESSIFHGLSNTAVQPAPLSGPGSGSSNRPPPPVLSGATAYNLGVTPLFARPPGYDASGYVAQDSGVEAQLATQKALLQYYGHRTPHDTLDVDLPMRSRLWSDVMPCVGCGGFIPSTRMAKHALECATESIKDLRLTGRFTLKPPTLTVCGCPMVPPPDDPDAFKDIPVSAPSSLRVAGRPVYFCPLNREDCVQHILWDSLTKAEIAQLHYLHTARLRALISEIDAVKRRMRERQQARASELDFVLSKPQDPISNPFGADEIAAYAEDQASGKYPGNAEYLNAEATLQQQQHQPFVDQYVMGDLQAQQQNQQMLNDDQVVGFGQSSLHSDPNHLTYLNELMNLAQALGYEVSLEALQALDENQLAQFREQLLLLHSQSVQQGQLESQMMETQEQELVSNQQHQQLSHEHQEQPLDSTQPQQQQIEHVDEAAQSRGVVQAAEAGSNQYNNTTQPESQALSAPPTEPQGENETRSVGQISG